jgi:carboxylate-amine ligase
VKACKAAVGAGLPAAERELLQSQVEVAFRPSTDFAKIRRVLARLRTSLAETGREHSILMLACSTHPLVAPSPHRD